MTAQNFHASCVAIGEFGLLIRGPSGSGKSDLVLRLLDETAHPYLGRVVDSYFSVQALSEFQSNSLWLTLNEYLSRIAQAYLSIFRACKNGEKKSAAIKPHLTLITARGMHALAGKLKLSAVRYVAAEAEIWAMLSEFYAYAEAKGYLNDALSLYGDSKTETSVKNIFSALLMWQACEAGSLRPLQLHIAERIINYLGEHLTIEGSYKPGSLLTYDLRRNQPPARMNGEATLHAGLRYIGVSEAPIYLGELICTLEKGSIPLGLNLGSKYTPGVVLEVARHLARGVSKTPVSRSNPRRKINVNICVASGMSMLDELASHRSNICETGESWATEDMSSNGFLCVLPASSASKVKIGELIALQPEKVEQWGAGIVQRLSHDSKNNLLVGIEMLSNQITDVVLHDDHVKSGKKTGAQRALYLNKSDDMREEAWLLMKPDSYTSKHSLSMIMDDKDYLLMPLELLKSGEDYVLARYRIWSR